MLVNLTKFPDSIFVVPLQVEIGPDLFKAGCDIHSVLASAAEAKFVRRPLRDVWNSYEAEADLKEAVADGLCAGLQPEEIEVFIDEALERAEVLVEEERIQRAFGALADALPDAGRLPGHIAVEIISNALSE